MDTSDRDIIASVLAGDRERFHELVRRHAGPIWTSVRSALRNTEDARDVFQDTWLRAFERLRGLRDPNRMRSWLLSIAFNLVRERQRHAGLVGFEPDDLALPQLVSGAPGTAEVLEQREDSEALRARIAALPSRQRDVLDLRMNHELSHGEIAGVLGITAENSRANYYQALRKLRASADHPDDGKPTL